MLLAVLFSTLSGPLSAAAVDEDQDQDGIPDERWDEYERLRKRFYEKCEDGRTTSKDTIPIIDLILQRFPNSEEFLKERASHYEERKEHQKSIAIYRRLLNKKPHMELYSKIATIELELGRLREALIDCDLAIAENPDWAETYFLKGYIQAKLGQMAGAKRAVNDGNYLASVEAWDPINSEHYREALRLLNLKALPQEALRTEKAKVLIDEIKTIAEKAVFASPEELLQSLGSVEWYRHEIPRQATVIHGKATDHWFSISLRVADHDWDLTLKPNKFFAVVEKGQIESQCGKPELEQGSYTHAEPSMRYQTAESRYSFILKHPYHSPNPRANGDVIREARIHWRTPAFKQFLTNARVEREKRKTVRGSKAADMIALIQKIDEELLSEPLSLAKVENVSGLKLYEQEGSNPTNWSNRRPSKQVEELPFEIRFFPQTIEAIYKLQLAPGNELYRTSRAQFEEKFGKGTISDGGRTVIYPRPYGSLSGSFEKSLDPGDAVKMVKPEDLHETPEVEYLSSLNFWLKPSDEKRSLTEFQASRTWRNLLNQGLACISKNQTSQAESYLRASFSAIPSYDYGSRATIVLPILKELRSAYIKLYKQDPNRLTYLERISCFEFQLQLIRQIAGVDKTFPTIAEYRENTWKVNISETTCYVDKNGLPPANTDESPELQKKFLKQFGVCEKRVEEIPAELVDELYFGR